jgi:WXG100 family type VII secretion target
VAGVLRMQLEATANTAQLLSQQADDLCKELADIARPWGELSSKWIGKARSAYELAWEEWYADAETVVAILAEHSARRRRALGDCNPNEEMKGDVRETPRFRCRQTAAAATRARSSGRCPRHCSQRFPDQ